jgi:phosphoserine phosphatase
MTTHLVINAPDLADAERARMLAALDVGGRRALLADTGRSIRVAARTDEHALIDVARQFGADAALLPATAHLGQFGLIAMDMDSTVITIECIDELADFAGVKAEVSAITASAMRGEIDFAESLRRRVALLEGLSLGALEDVMRDRLRFSPGAEALMQAARACNVQTLLVSGGFTWFTDRVRQTLGIDQSRGNQLGMRGDTLDGRIDGPVFDGAGKASAVAETAARLGLSAHQVMVIGDGANDLPMMKQAGTSVAYHAKPVVRAAANLAIDFGGLDTLLEWFPPRA